MQIKEARWIVAAFGLITCVLVAFYFVKLFRDMAMGASTDLEVGLTDFERLRREGKLNEEEYQKVKESVPRGALPNDLESSASRESSSSSKAAPDFRELKDTD